MTTTRAPLRLPLLDLRDASEQAFAFSSAEARSESSEPMLVGDLARIAGKTVRAIHLYEQLDLLRPLGRSKGRYRLYGPEALVRVRWIGKLQDMGFSLTDIQTVVRDWEQQVSAPRTMVKMREVYAKKLEETRTHLRRLMLLEREISSSLRYLDTCDVCEPHHLLDACGTCSHHATDVAVPDLIRGFRSSGLHSEHCVNTAPSKDVVKKTRQPRLNGNG